MSEYQRYEFMTVDKPLTQAQLKMVDELSSHIEASTSHALIEYHHGDFKHNPIDVLYKYFDGFLYWANWGTPQFALRFPHGILPGNLLEGYDMGDFVTFKQRADYDILDIHFDEMESGDWMEGYELGPLMPIREELMAGDLRSLYVVWLGAQIAMEGYDEDEDYEDEDDEDYEEEDENEEENETRGTPVVPPDFRKLTAAQLALADLLAVPKELLATAGQHSSKVTTRHKDDFPAWIEQLSQEKRNNYLLRLAQNEPGLSHLLVRELRTFGQGNSETVQTAGERVSYTRLYSETKAMQNKREQEKRERERRAREKQLQDIYEQREAFWKQVDTALARQTSQGYDEAVEILSNLREAMDRHNETEAFQERFNNWVLPHRRRSSLMRRLKEHEFSLP